MNNIISKYLKNNAEDFDLIINFLVIAIPIILVNTEGYIPKILSSILVIILGIANVYSSKIRRNEINNEGA